MSDELLRVVQSHLTKQPRTASQAVALCENVLQKEIVPIMTKLKAWAIEKLPPDEQERAMKVWKDMGQDAVCMVWCVPIFKS